MAEDVNGVSPETKLVYSPARTFVGRSRGFTTETRNQIADMWRQFASEAGELLAKLPSYGISYGMEGDSFQYLCGLDQTDDLPQDWDKVDVPESRYLVFTYTGPASGISAAFDTIWDKLLPEAKLKHEPRPVLELYDERFDGSTQSGVVEFWIPIGAE